jgi:hypothetical protein
VRPVSTSLLFATEAIVYLEKDLQAVPQVILRAGELHGHDLHVYTCTCSSSRLAYEIENFILWAGLSARDTKFATTRYGQPSHKYGLLVP